MRLNKAMATPDTLAKRVKLARTALKMSQEMLAKKSGLKQADISKIETGRILRTTGIVALARALRADIDWLADGIGNIRPDGTRQLTPSNEPVRALADAPSRVWPFKGVSQDDYQKLDDLDRAQVEGFIKGLLRSGQQQRKSNGATT